MKLLTGFFAASLAFGAGAGVSAATLDGLTVDITSAHGDCLGVTVGAGEECSVFDLAAKDDDVIAVDVGSSSLRFSFVDLTARSNYLWSTAPTAFNVVVSGLTGFTLTSQLYTAIGGQIGGWVSAAQTGSGEITLTYDDMSMDQGCTNGMICGTLDVFGTVADLPVAQRAFSPGGPLPVPLPASLPLLLAGLGGVGLLGRSRRKPD